MTPQQPPTPEDPPRVLCRHADVVAAARDPETFSSAVSRHLQIPNGLDGEEHARFRPLIDSFFIPDRMAALASGLRALARDAVAALPRGAEVDAVADLGSPYAVRATCVWLGWPLELEDELLAWMADNQAATRSGEYERTAEVALRFDALIRRLLAVRRGPDAAAEAPQDVTTELTRVTVDGRRLTEDEIVSVLRNWTAGDIASIALCVGVVVRYLAERPEIQESVRRQAGDPERLDRAIEEILRIDDPFVANRRVATCPVTLGTTEIAAGQRVLLSWREANRDPARFPDPDRFDPDGHAADNLVYGTGPHVCPGRPLARLVLRVLVEELLWATPSWVAGGPAQRQEPPLGGYRVAPVVLGPAAQSPVTPLMSREDS